MALIQLQLEEEDQQVHLVEHQVLLQFFHQLLQQVVEVEQVHLKIQVAMEFQEVLEEELEEQDQQLEDLETHHQLVHHKEILEEILYKHLDLIQEEVEEVELQEMVVQELVLLMVLEELGEVEEQVHQIVFQDQLYLMQVVEEVEVQHLVDFLEQQVLVEQEVLEDHLVLMMLLMEQLTQVVEVEVVEHRHQHLKREMEDRVLLLSEHQDQQIFLQDQVQTQLQHYRHQLEVVKLRHSRFLEI